MAKPNIFDRAVIAVAPVHAAKRAAARAALSVINSGYGNYGANLTKKSMRGWEFYGGSPKEDIEDNIRMLPGHAETPEDQAEAGTGPIVTAGPNEALQPCTFL